MSAAYLDLAWDTQSDVEVEMVHIQSARTLPAVRRLGLGRKSGRCPACDSIIYSKRHKLCGVCGEALPENLLFTVTEAQRVERLLHVERMQHKKWLEQRTKL
jgi:hypothetical protein